jgi:hypothetical protein
MTQSPARTLVIDKKGIGYLQWPLSAANQRLDFYLDVNAAVYANNDEISSMQISISPSGSGEMSVADVKMDDGVIRLDLQGGVPGRVYKIKVAVNTLRERDYFWTLSLPIEKDNFVGPFPIAPNPGFGNVDTWAAIVLENGDGFLRLENDLGNWVWG